MAADLVVTNVTLIDGSDADPVRAADIVIRDGLIVASGCGAAAAVDLAASPTVVGDGLFLVPGYLGIAHAPASAPARRRTTNAGRTRCNTCRLSSGRHHVGH